MIITDEQKTMLLNEVDEATAYFRTTVDAQKAEESKAFPLSSDLTKAKFENAYADGVQATARSVADILGIRQESEDAALKNLDGVEGFVYSPNSDEKTQTAIDAKINEHGTAIIVDMARCFAKEHIHRRNNFELAKMLSCMAGPDDAEIEEEINTFALVLTRDAGTLSKTLDIANKLGFGKEADAIRNGTKQFDYKEFISGAPSLCDGQIESNG